MTNHIVISAVNGYFTAYVANTPSMPRVFKCLTDLERYVSSTTSNFKLPIVFRISDSPFASHGMDMGAIEAAITVLARYAYGEIAKVA